MSPRAWLVAGLSLIAAMPPAAAARTPHHPSSAHVRPRAFASCASLVHYARRHFATTHGLPQAVPLAGGGGPVRSAIAQALYGQTVITEVDAHDPAAMHVARTVTVDGAFVDARQNGSTARLVISSTPRAIAVPALRATARGW